MTIDTLRADRVGCYGHAAARTPHLDRLCEEGVVFENAIAPAPLTLPSHASILTGLHPSAHGLHTNAGAKLASEYQTLTEALRPRVRRAGAVVGSVVLDARFGLGQGFDDYDDRMPPAPPGHYLFQRERGAEGVAAAAAAWIREHAGEPFFLWVHFYDPHAPYEPPPPWEELLGDPYDGEVAAADRGLGQVLEALDGSGARDATLVVVAGDHGEDLGQHGEPTHGVFLYDSTLRVPLIFRYPRGLRSGRRLPGIVRLVDVMPTVLELFALPPDEHSQGRSLVDLLTARRRDLGLEAFCESRLPELQYGWAPLAALRQREWMYIRAPEEELYALGDDPDQTRNLAGAQAERLAELRQRLAAAERAFSAATDAPRAAVSEEMRRQLESLGYIGAPSGRAPSSSASRADPKRRVALLASLSEASEWVAWGRAHEAEPSLRAILVEDPQNPFALRLHARSLAMLGRQEEARAGYEKLLALAGEDAEVLNSLGAIDLRAGRLDRAERRFRRALEVSPGDARARNNLAFVLAERGQSDEAVRLLEAILEQDPLFLEAVLNLALLRQDLGQSEEAERVLRRAHEQAPGDPSLSGALARLLAGAGRAAEGLEILQRALGANPRSVSLRIDLAGLLERLGRRAEAARLYNEVLAAGDVSAAQRRTARAALSRLRSGR